MIEENFECWDMFFLKPYRELLRNKQLRAFRLGRLALEIFLYHKKLSIECKCHNILSPFKSWIRFLLFIVILLFLFCSPEISFVHRVLCTGQWPLKGRDIRIYSSALPLYYINRIRDHPLGSGVRSSAGRASREIREIAGLIHNRKARSSIFCNRSRSALKKKIWPDTWNFPPS